MAESLVQRVGKSIAAHRLQRGWSQQDLADKSGIGQSTISRYEAGDRVMGIEALVRLSNALNVAPGVLLCGMAPGRPLAVATAVMKEAS